MVHFNDKTKESELIADDLLRESIHRLYWKAMVDVIGEEKSQEVMGKISGKQVSGE
ncbi:hypothetical protein [Niallia taxi]|uniref:hypothetical protein n=1 Tax=Niallia taxi TaxID=2499688 RepID=UPI00300BE115